MLAAAPPPNTILLNKPEDVGIMSAPSGCTSSGGLFEDVNNLFFCGSSSTLCTSGPIDVNGNEYDMHDVTSTPRVTGNHLRNNHVHFDRNVHFGDDKADHECHYKAFLKKEDHNNKSSHHHHRGNSESRRLQQKSKGYSHHYQQPTAVSTHSMNGHNTHRRNNTAEEQIFSPFNDMDGLYVFH